MPDPDPELIFETFWPEELRVDRKSTPARFFRKSAPKWADPDKWAEAEAEVQSVVDALFSTSIYADQTYLYHEESMKPYGVKAKSAIFGKKDGVLRGLPQTNTNRKANTLWKNCQKGVARAESKRLARSFDL